MAALLRRFTGGPPALRLWLEPGRFLVAAAGVLLARVTQIKRKGEVTYVGMETGMNSLIRPALYGAYHPIVNLSRLERARHLDRPRRGPDLRDRRHPRPLAPPAAAPPRGTCC